MEKNKQRKSPYFSENTNLENEISIKWQRQRALDRSHADLHRKILYLNPDIGNIDIEAMRNIVFTRVVQESGHKKPSVSINERSIHFDIQSVNEDLLLKQLNLDFNTENLVPSKGDILRSISPSTREEIYKLEKTLKHRRIAFLYGPTGVGKTTLIKTLAYHKNQGIYQETGSRLKTFNDLTTTIKFRKTESGREAVSIPSGLIKAALTGAIYQIDEFNYLPGDVQLAIAQIVDENQITLYNGVKLPIHPDFVIVGTGNIGYGGTNQVNDAVLRRADGGQEITYLPEKEEIESIYKDYLYRVDEINELRGLDLDASIITEDEVKKLIKKLRDLRILLENKYKEEIKKMSKNKRRSILSVAKNRLIAMEDIISFHEQISFRKISDALLKSLLQAYQENKEIIKYRTIFLNTFPSASYGQEQLTEICGKHFLGAFLKLKKTKRRGDEKKKSAFERYVSDPDTINEITEDPKMFLALLGKTINFSEGLDTNLKKSKHNNRSDFLSLKDLEINAKMPDFKWEEESVEIEGDSLKTNEKVRLYLKKIQDFLLGITENENGEKLYMKLKNNRDSILSFKNIAEFQYKGQKGFALIAWRGLITDAVFYNQNKNQFFLAHKDRINTHVQVYFPDKNGNVVINPETGHITTLSKIGKLKPGYLRVSVPNKREKDDDFSQKNYIKSLVKHKIKTAFIHAEAKDVDESKGIRSVSQNIFPALEEGRGLAMPLTAKNAGRYFEYKTPTIRKNLDLMKRENVLRNNLLLTGPSGTGKTSYVKSYAIDNKRPYVAVQFHERVSEHEILKSVQLKDGQIVEAPLPLLKAFKYGWVAELREINLANPSFIAFINTVLDKNGMFFVDGEKIVRHPNFLPVATRNPYSDIFSGTKAMPSSFTNRFTAISIDYANPHEELNMLVKLCETENPELLNNIGKKSLRKMLTIIIRISNQTRNKLKNEDFIKRASDQLISILQKQRWSTDLLQNLLRSSRNKEDLKNQFYEKFKMTDEEENVLEINNIHYALNLQELNKI